MKIRSGFVSNSSSSSFIVAFPHKPTDVDDVLDMMFNGDKEGHVTARWGDETLSHTDICDRVFGDINGKVKKAELIDDFAARYRVSDGKLYYGGAKYFATDKVLVNKLIDMESEHNAEYKSFSTFERELVLKNIGREPKYACSGGVHYDTKKPCSDSEIEKYNTYVNEVATFKKTNAEFKTRMEQRDKLTKNYYNEARKLREQLAKSDVDAFIKDNKKAFITTFSYSDNDGSEGSLMEHSDIFRNLNHITISHH